VYKENPLKKILKAKQKFSFNKICMFYKNEKYSERISYKEVIAEEIMITEIVNGLIG